MADEIMNRQEPVYMISVVAKMIDCHPQTLRLYERLGLITPHRRGHIRMFSEADIERLNHIRRMKEDMGVNLAGIEVILKLLNQIDELQQEVDRIRAREKRRLQRLSENW